MDTGKETPRVVLQSWRYRNCKAAVRPTSGQPARLLHFQDYLLTNHTWLQGHAKAIYQADKRYLCAGPYNLQGNHFFSALWIYHLWGNWYVQSQAFLKGLPIICAISVNPCCENFPGWVLPNTLHVWPTAPIRAQPKGLWTVSVVSSHISHGISCTKYIDSIYTAVYECSSNDAVYFQNLNLFPQSLVC